MDRRTCNNIYNKFTEQKNKNYTKPRVHCFSKGYIWNIFAGLVEPLPALATLSQVAKGVPGFVPWQSTSAVYPCTGLVHFTLLI